MENARDPDREARPMEIGAIFSWRRARASGPYERHQRTFNFIDRETNPTSAELWTSTERGYFGERLSPADVERRRQALDALLAAVLRGMALRRDGQIGIRPYEDIAVDPEHVREVSSIHLVAFQLFTDWDGPSARRTGDHGLDLEGIADAFDLFGRGELALVGDADRIDGKAMAEYERQACQPNSGFFVLFAELAELCETRGVHADVWGWLKPHLVASIGFFIETYGTSLGMSRNGVLTRIGTARRSLHETRAMRREDAYSSPSWWKRLLERAVPR